MNQSEEYKRRKKILIFWGNYGLKATREAFGVGRSTLFLWKQKDKNKDLEPKSRKPKRMRTPCTPMRIVEAVRQYRCAFPFLGKDKLEHLLGKAGFNISASTIGRIIERNNLPSAPRRHIAKQKKKIKRTHLPIDYEIKNPGDLIGMDTIVIQEQMVKKYIITAVDYRTRIAVSRAYKTASSRQAKDLLLRMKIALGVPILAVNTDNGGEFLAEYEKACRQLEIKHFFTYPRTPKMNPLAERFNRTIQEEAQFPLFQEPLEIWNKFIAHYIMLYNFFRPHFSLDYKTPVDVFLTPNQSNMLWTHTPPPQPVFLYVTIKP